MKFVKKTKQHSESLTERTHTKLREDILSGKIAGGTRLVESVLAEQLSVSRTPIREALRQLELEGLLYSIPRVGYMVEEMSTQDVLDLFNTRMAIEQVAARWATEKITPDEIAALEINLQKTEAVIESGLPEKLTELDIEFHGIIYRASRNKLLYQICQTLSDHTLKFRLAMIHIPKIPEKTLKGHQEIFEAIVSGETPVVEEKIQRHLQRARGDIVIILENMRQETF